MAPETQISRTIYGDLRRAIESGEYEPGTALPTYDELHARYGAGASTISRALAALQADGFAIGVRGQGVIVRDRSARRRIVRGRLVRRDPARGYVMPATHDAREPWQTHGKPRASMEPCPPHIASLLGVPAWTETVRRRRVTSPAGEAPFQVADSWIHPDVLAEAPQAGQPDTGPGGYLDRIEEAGHGPLTWDEEIGTRMPERDEAKLLGISRSLPVLEIARVGTSARTGGPVEVTVCVIPGDRARLVTKLERDRSAAWPTSPPTGRYV